MLFRLEGKHWLARHSKQEETSVDKERRPVLRCAAVSSEKIDGRDPANESDWETEKKQRGKAWMQMDFVLYGVYTD